MMKHAFDADGLRSIVCGLTRMLSHLENGARATLAEKIVVYLGEYLDEEVVEELRMRMSIGQVLGIKTAGDRLRAAERATARATARRVRKQEREKYDAQNAARDKRIAEYLQSIGVSAKKINTALAIK